MIYIYYGENATSMEHLACKHLQSDLNLVTGDEIHLAQISKSLDGSDYIILVGTPSTNSLIETLSKEKKIPITETSPGKRGGCISIIDYKDFGKVLILAGCDSQGAQYAVYGFSKSELGVDPFQFWTGYKPHKIDFSFDIVKERVIAPPLVPILCYFDNDNDELANMTDPYLEFSFAHWKEIINSLVRLKYNAIDMHDHLGRVEYYERKAYLKLRPNYETNLELVEKVIDYAHQMGMMVQIPMYLGWQFHSISDKARKNWPKYKQEWIDAWNYYLKETPIGKCDIFLNRPRDQKWDRRYKGKGDPAEVFNEAFSEMYKVIKAHNPHAIIVCDLYMEGIPLFEDGFNPPHKDIIMAWPNNGFGKIERFPGDFKGYPLGVYVHAGYFLNHVVHDPYPELLATSMKTAFLDKGMTEYCLVNGQTFRHFILNLEACSILCDAPEKFNAETFYQAWVSRYFGTEANEEVVEILKTLHLAQENGLGYVRLLVNLIIMRIALLLMKYLIIAPNSFIRRLFIKYGEVGEEYTSALENNINLLKNALKKAEDIQPKILDQNHLFHDLIILQIKLLLQLNQIAYNLQLVFLNYKEKKYLKKAIRLVKEHTETRMKGDKNARWNTWYDPKKARPHGGYPSIKKLKKLLPKSERYSIF